MIISNIIDLMIMNGWDQSQCNGSQSVAEEHNDTRQDYKFTRLNLFCVVVNKQEEKINS